MNIKVLVATHKSYKMPSDTMYIPIQVGRALNKNIGYIGDDTGENISVKNPYYCELTALYWGVKNLECDYIGLVHYRRHFSNKKRVNSLKSDKFEYIISVDEVKKILEEYDVVLPKIRRYYIETLYSHYAHTHYADHLDKTRGIIKKIYPEYVKSFDEVMRQTSGHMFNMFIMKKELANEYCEWLFNILGRLEEEVDVAEYDSFQARLYGRVSELLLNVWINNKGLKYKEVPHMHMEKINWINKGSSFIKAKFSCKKFQNSF